MTRFVRHIVVVSIFSAVSLAQALPAGTVLPVSLKSRIESKKDAAGKKFEGSVMQQVQLIDGRLIKQGARVSGHVISASSTSSGANLVLRFDSLENSGQTIPLNVRLLAVASMMSVSEAQAPVNALATSSANEWDTRQVGGDVVWRGRGAAESATGVKGIWLEGSSVMMQLTPDPDAGCPAGPGYNFPQSLWVFSSAACGTYGFKDLSIARDSGAKPGNIELNSQGNIDIRPGSGWLLIVPAVPAPANASGGPK